jgi:hypothetical protein
MTDSDITSALRDLAESVTEHRVSIGRELGVLGARVGTLQESHNDNAKKLDEVLRLELSCPARSDNDGQNARLKQLELGEKIRIESELKQARDEITGQVDVMQRRTGERNYSETPQARFVKFVAPYVWKGLLIFGIAIGGAAVARCAGDDQVATARSLQAVTDMIRATAADVEQVKAVVDDVAADTEESVSTAGGSSAGAGAQ